MARSLAEAVVREVREETSLSIEAVALAGHRDVITRDAQGKIERHFVILCFAARWLSGEPVLNDELDDARWIEPPELGAYRTTEGLAEIVAAAAALLAPNGLISLPCDWRQAGAYLRHGDLRVNA